MSLLAIGEQITIYGGLFLLISGIIGNGINILIFLTFRNYRRTPCTFYFLIASIFNIIYITINLISRIVSAGFGFDLTRISNSWCKIRQFSLVTLSLITLTCSCLATIDQFFVTSRNANLRQYSNIKWAHRLVFIFIIVWSLHGIPVLIYYNISSATMTCININGNYAVYAPIYLLGLICAVPVLIMGIFAYLTYRNIHLTRTLVEHQVDRQLAAMTLIQVLLDVICFVPYSIFITYGLITTGVNKTINRLIIEGFLLTLFSLIPYIYYSGSCYMFLISSSRFRRATRERLFFYFKPNQIAAAQQQTAATGTLNYRTT